MAAASTATPAPTAATNGDRSRPGDGSTERTLPTGAIGDSHQAAPTAATRPAAIGTNIGTPSATTWSRRLNPRRHQVARSASVCRSSRATASASTTRVTAPTAAARTPSAVTAGWIDRSTRSRSSAVVVAIR